MAWFSSDFMKTLVLGTHIFSPLATKGGCSNHWALVTFCSQLHGRKVVGGCSHSVCRVQRSFKHHSSRGPCIAWLLLLSPAPFQSLKMPFCRGVISISPPSFKMALKTNSLWIQSYWFLSIPFQPALYYPSTAHWVPGLPGSFALLLEVPCHFKCDCQPTDSKQKNKVSSVCYLFTISAYTFFI